MKEKRKPNGYTEKRGKQSFTRNISERMKDHPDASPTFDEQANIYLSLVVNFDV